MQEKHYLRELDQDKVLEAGQVLSVLGVLDLLLVVNIGLNEIKKILFSVSRTQNVFLNALTRKIEASA